MFALGMNAFERLANNQMSSVATTMALVSNEKRSGLTVDESNSRKCLVNEIMHRQPYARATEPFDTRLLFRNRSYFGMSN